MGAKILIADDESDIVSMLGSFFESKGFRVLPAFNGAEALKQVEKQPDIILLDINMPGTDGLEVCKRIRDHISCPILFLTARIEDTDKVKGFTVGGDDYIVKPFSPGEVMARIRAVLRRIPAAEEKETLVVGELSIHLPSLSVALSGHKLNLTRREVELLYTLASAPGRVFTRDNLLTMVWGYEFLGNYRAVDSHIKRLRAKLDVYPHESFAIATVWGAGYKFERKLP